MTNTLSSNANIHAITPNDGPWWHPDDPPETPELLNPLDHTLGDLLYHSIKSCKDRMIPWRAGYSLRYVRIFAIGVKVRSGDQHISRAYELRQDSFEMEPDELHLAAELAPSGTEYTFENSGVRVAIRVIEPNSRYIRDMGQRAAPPTGAWERAFRNSFRRDPLQAPGLTH
ncbi:hypothetical protein P167DRAFT_149388 [Morchella conica CCBAS932]|uniref:Uncharacterized protein n=1 Tax=Morchella conica CCBAS932 TaxID=1392247 RepID=A0A3N4KAH9_9PEZI|nr:hypothetical protein P167DRAFT_149388 [Morchella conica CCBAS932]